MIPKTLEAFVNLYCLSALLLVDQIHQHSKDRNAKVRNAKDRDPEDVDSREANWMWVYNSMRIALDGFNKPILVYPGSFRSVESPTLTITPDPILSGPNFRPTSIL
ncbi:hypothetical protein KEM48_011896 [Puccinia striiformis f. sp. tritici PST-130]|nr:hypothetical protein KEM48_011896 [Puccinia striiformis f. sp. tritici PST-130]